MILKAESRNLQEAPVCVVDLGYSVAEDLKEILRLDIKSDHPIVVVEDAFQILSSKRAFPGNVVIDPNASSIKEGDVGTHRCTHHVGQKVAECRFTAPDRRLDSFE